MRSPTVDRHRLLGLFIPLLALCLFAPPAARAQDGPPVRIQPADVAAGDFFGCALDLDVDAEHSRLLVGSLLDDDRGQSSGSAYVFELTADGWVETAKLIGEATTAGNQLGFAVGVAGDVVVLGAPLATGGGRGHVFTLVDGTWIETGILSGTAGGAALGSSVAIDPRGRRVALGAPSGGAGAVFLYALAGPGAPQPGPTRLVPSSAATGDAAGWSVALSGNLLATGAPYADPLGASSGAVYLFDLGGGELPRLTAPGGRAFDAFGYSLALAGDLLAVGAPEADVGGASSGAVYIFRRAEAGGFVHEATLPGVGPGDQMGTSVALEGGLLAAGARRQGGVGAVHLFRQVDGVWREVGRLQPGTASAGDDVGIAVALSGEGLAFGAFRDDRGGADAGSVYARAPVPEEPEPVTDLTVTIAFPAGASAAPGASPAFVVTVTNTGPDAAAGARVVATPDPLLTGVTWTCAVTPGARCTRAGARAVADRVALPAGGTATYTISGALAPSAAGSLSQTASATPPAGAVDPSPADAVATLTIPIVPVADLSFDIDLLRGDALGALAAVPPDAPGATALFAIPGLGVQYGLEIANAGPSSSGQLVFASGGLAPVFVDPVWTCVPGGGATCSPTEGTGAPAGRIELPPGGVVTYRLDARVAPNATGTLVLTGTLGDLPDLDPDPSNNSDRVTTPLVARSDVTVDLAVAPPTATTGGAAILTVTVTNEGPSDAAGFRVTSLLPPALAPVSFSCVPGPPTCAGGAGALSDALALAAGAAAVYTVTTTALPDYVGPFEISAEARPAARLDDPDLSDNQATTGLSLLPPFGTAKATLDVTGSFFVGSTVTYTFVLIYNGPSDLPDGPSVPEVTLSLPPEVSVTSFDASSGTVGGASFPGADLFWNGPLASGESLVIVVEGTILPGTQGSTAVAQGEYFFIPPSQDEFAAGETSPPGDAEGPTVFMVGTALEIPGLTPWGIALLSLLLAIAGVAALGSWRPS